MKVLSVIPSNARSRTIIYSNLPRGNKYVCLYINGKRQLITAQHVSTHSKFIKLLQQWDKDFILDGKFASAHITYDGTLRTFARVAKDDWFEC